MHARFLFVVCGLAFIAGCTHSQSEPTGTGAAHSVEGQAVSAVDGGSASGVSVQVGNVSAVTSDASGNFDTDIIPGTYTVVVRSNAFVQRQTSISAPTNGRQRLSLIPASFDIGAFDEMCRALNGQLERWITRPSVVVLASTMRYTGASDEFTASSEQMSDDEVSQLVAHMTEGLALLTGNTYTSFGDVAVERPESGQRVSAARAGKIVVGRYTGITSWDGTIGLGRWAEGSDGSIVAGAMFLDRDFDKNDARRRLLRIHELGHALGYQHVTTRPSIMYPSIGPEPSDFDRAASIIAFQRLPGNQSPDTDPGQHAGWNAVGSLRWSRFVP
jgi:hypothetical protein